MRIDAHQHFWIYDPNRDAWITDNMSIIQRDFLPNDISFTLKNNGIDGVVAIQADQSEQETRFLMDLAQVYKMIKGVVGWVDLRSDNIDELLDAYSQYDIVKGFRHIIEGEASGNFLTTDEFLRGIESLTKHNYTYDLLIRPRHYQSTLNCVKSNPKQKFMLDHLAKPPIKSQEFEDWGIFIEELASYKNVYCKISGLATEADWAKWRLEDFRQYVDHVVKCFGKNRICFGSDWPVCLLASTFEQSIEIVTTRLNSFTGDDLDKFWGLNAVNFYNLK